MSRRRQTSSAKSHWHRHVHVKVYTWLLLDGLFFLSWLAIGTAIWFFRSSNLQVSLPSVLGTSSDITVAKVQEAINQKRQENGIGPLAWNDALAQAAQAKASDMIARGYWSHITPDGQQPWSFVEATGYHYRVAGENLARSFPTTDAMIAAWMDSPTHRANLLHSAYQETGIATVNGVMDGQETTLVVQMFGAPAEGSGQQITEVVLARGEITQSAPNIARWLTTGPQSQSAGNVLGLFDGSAPVTLYRVGMIAIVGTAIALLVMDSFHPRHKNTRRKHPLVRPSKHMVHIALLVATLLTVGLAEAGSLL